MGTEFSSGVTKMFWSQIEVMTAQFVNALNATKCHFKMNSFTFHEHFMWCDVYLNSKRSTVESRQEAFGRNVTTWGPAPVPCPHHPLLPRGALSPPSCLPDLLIVSSSSPYSLATTSKTNPAIAHYPAWITAMPPVTHSLPPLYHFFISVFLIFSELGISGTIAWIQDEKRRH